MEVCQKETSIKVGWHTSEGFVIPPSHLGYQRGIRRLHRWVNDLTFCQGKIGFQFQSHTAELQTVDYWMAKKNSYRFSPIKRTCVQHLTCFKCFSSFKER